jgi:hypothetical protein
MRALLVAGADYAGYLNRRGAVHLLTFTDLPGWKGFPHLVDVERVHDRHIHDWRNVAFVKNWSTLVADTRAARISDSGRRLLDLAVSMAAGVPVDLADALTGFGHAHRRRVVEAMHIATGSDEFYTLTFTPTPELDELNAFHAKMERL